MASIIDTIKYKYRTGSMLMKLIFINIGVFIALRLGAIVCLLAGIDEQLWLRWVELPSDPSRLLVMPWTLLTYMFAQYDIFHILFNMLWLYWFGTIFMLTGTSRRLVALYIYGGIGGALTFLAAYNLLPAFSGEGWLIGSSASVLAIVTGTAILHPDYKMGLLFLGEISLKWVAIVTIGIDLLSIGGTNAGGHIAHIGGAIVGAIYGLSLNRGVDITKPFNSMLDNITNILRRLSEPKTNYRQTKNSSYSTKNNYSNTSAATNEASLDEILDKIKKSGYTSLTNEEKRRLFEVSKNIK